MASSQFNTTRELKRESISFILSNYTKSHNYYVLPVPNTHHYLIAELTDWGNASAAPFTSTYDDLNKRISVITGTPEPSRVNFDLWYYE